MNTIRNVQKKDINALKAVIDSSELFPSEYLDGMIEDYFTNEDTTDIWLTVDGETEPIAVAYCAPEKMTEGTYNLYLIAVQKTSQGQGIGAVIMEYVENLLREMKQRILIVETSGLPEFELTRTFYDNCNYTREAQIRDFYQEGDDKIVFWKKL